jgi:predicted GNAT family acetyltransferase
MIDNVSRRQYELVTDGGAVLAVISYLDRPGARVLVHTEVDPAHEGEGLGSRLVDATLADIRSRGLELVPLCPFVRAYLRDHPEHRDLVGAQAR